MREPEGQGTPEDTLRAMLHALIGDLRDYRALRRVLEAFSDDWPALSSPQFLRPFYDYLFHHCEDCGARLADDWGMISELEALRIGIPGEYDEWTERVCAACYSRRIAGEAHTWLAELPSRRREQRA